MSGEERNKDERVMKIGRILQQLVLAGLLAVGMAGPASAAGGPRSGLPPAVTEQTLYRFCALGGCTDGSSPHSVIVDGAGNLYGTTYAGGSHDAGTVFQLALTCKGWTDKAL